MAGPVFPNVERPIRLAGIIGTAVRQGGQGGLVNRSKVLHLLAQNKPALAARFGVLRLALFGSTVRDAAGPESDIDILVYFDGPATSERYFGVQFFLEDLLGRPIDQ